MTLKTLKDLFSNDRHEFKPASYGCSCGACSEGCFGSCDVVKLKAEAVKIIKVLKEEQRYKEGVEIPKEHLSFFDEEYYSFENVINFIMWQNNLTEEEINSRQPTQQGGELDENSDELSSALGSPADVKIKGEENDRT